MNLGLDIGYDRTKLYTKSRQVSFASVTGTPETSSFGFSDDGAGGIVLVHPQAVSVGAQAIEQSAAVDARTDRGWLDGEKWYTLALAAFSEAIRGNAALNLVCGLPVSYYSDKAKVKERLLGTHTFQRAGRNRQTVTVERVIVMPQGFGILFAECLSNSGSVTNQALQSGRVGVIDVGGKTTNLLVANQLSQIDEESRSLDTGGWSVVARVQAYLESEYPDLGLNEYELVPHVIARSVNYRGKSVDLTTIVNKAVSALAVEIIGGARRLWNGAARLDTILIAGGGAHLVGPALLAEYPGQARIVESDPVFANALGYWRFCQARWR